MPKTRGSAIEPAGNRPKKPTPVTRLVEELRICNRRAVQIAEKIWPNVDFAPVLVERK